jgi:Fe-S cluster biogenesis protein NfuA
VPSQPTDDVLARRVQAKLDSYIRPNLHMHGGDAVVASVEHGVVTLEMAGACDACMFRPNTYASVLRPVLMDVDGVTEVRVAGVRISRHALARIDAARETAP